MIKVLLIISTIASFFTYLKFFRTALLDKLIAMLICFCALVSILFPDITMFFANLLGVGRGADLVFYLYIVASVFVFIALYSKIMNLNSAITTLSREMALRGVRDSD